MQEEHSYNGTARRPYLVHFSQWTAVSLHLGGRDSQADQSAGGIPSARVIQDLVDKVRSLPGNR